MANVELEKARVRLYQKSDRRQAIIALSSVLLVLFGFVGFLNLINSVNLGFRGDQTPAERFIYWLVLGTLGFIGPYGFFLAKKQREIKKMAAQISWGVPATEALRLFSERVKTPMVQRVIAIIVKSSDAGGDVADVLTMVSHDTKENQLTEDERRIAMSTYIAVIYISFMVFL